MTKTAKHAVVKTVLEMKKLYHYILDLLSPCSCFRCCEDITKDHANDIITEMWDKDVRYYTSKRYGN